MNYKIKSTDVVLNLSNTHFVWNKFITRFTSYLLQTEHLVQFDYDPLTLSFWVWTVVSLNIILVTENI